MNFHAEMMEKQKQEKQEQKKEAEMTSSNINFYVRYFDVIDESNPRFFINLQYNIIK